MGAVSMPPNKALHPTVAVLSVRARVNGVRLCYLDYGWFSR